MNTDIPTKYLGIIHCCGSGGDAHFLFYKAKNTKQLYLSCTLFKEGWEGEGGCFAIKSKVWANNAFEMKTVVFKYMNKHRR